MTTKLDKQLRREVKIGGEAWVVTITPLGLRLTLKGRRKGIELEWKDLVSGDAAMAVALNASLRPKAKRSSTTAAKDGRSKLRALR